MNNTIKSNDRLVKNTFKHYMITAMLINLVAIMGMVIDKIFVGWLIGSDALAAMSISSPLFLFLLCIAGLFQTGGGSLAGYYVGMGDKNKANLTFTICMAGCLIAGILFAIVGIFFSRSLAILLGAQGDLIPLAQQYLQATSIGAFPIVLCTVLMMFVRMDGSQKLSTYCAIVILVSNVILDWLLVMVFPWGMFGLAIATVISYALGDLVLCTHFFRGNNHSLRFVKMRNSGDTCLKIFTTGLPMSVYRLATTLRSFVFNHLLLICSTVIAVTAYSVQLSVYACLNAVVAGIGETVLLLCGIFYGEKDTLSIRKTLKTGLSYGLIIATALSLLTIPFAGGISSIFGVGVSNEAFASSVIAVRLYALCVPFLLVNTCFRSLYQSTGRPLRANIICICDSFGIGILFALALSGILGEKAIWYSFLVGEAGTILLVVLFSLRNKNRDLLEKIIGLDKDLGKDSIAIGDFSVGNNIDDASKVSSQVWDFCDQHQVDKRIKYSVSLCVEEMTKNVIEHGFVKTKNPAVDVCIRLTESGMTLRIRDNGKAFNPETNSTNEDTVSGYGTRLVRGMAKNIQYHRSIGINDVLITL